MSAILILDVPIYTSFISTLADSDVIADELNPLTISHTAKTISCKNIGICPISISVDAEADAEKNWFKYAANPNMTPIRPQIANHRGMSLDR